MRKLKLPKCTTVVKVPEESDSGIVPKKLANKGEAPPAEPMEERTLAERNFDMKPRTAVPRLPHGRGCQRCE